MWLIDIPKPPLDLLFRFDRIDRGHPTLDRVRVHEALARHLNALGLPLLPVDWAQDPITAYERVRLMTWHPAWEEAISKRVRLARDLIDRGVPLQVACLQKLAREGGEEIAERAAQLTVLTAAKERAANSTTLQEMELVEQVPTCRGFVEVFWPKGIPRNAIGFTARGAGLHGGDVLAQCATLLGLGCPPTHPYLAAWLPFLDAVEAGLWLCWILENTVVAIPRPVLRIRKHRLHSPDGPAVAWPQGPRYYFWDGVQVPKEVITNPTRLGPLQVLLEPNGEIRRVMIERYPGGPGQFLLDTGARIVDEDQDSHGLRTLFRMDLPGDEPLVMVRVHCVRKDGKVDTYFLRVPPKITTCAGAVAFTFGKRPAEYCPAAES